MSIYIRKKQESDKILYTGASNIFANFDKGNIICLAKSLSKSNARSILVRDLKNICKRKKLFGKLQVDEQIKNSYNWILDCLNSKTDVLTNEKLYKIILQLCLIIVNVRLCIDHGYSKVRASTCEIKDDDVVLFTCETLLNMKLQDKENKVISQTKRNFNKKIKIMEKLSKSMGKSEAFFEKMLSNVFTYKPEKRENSTTDMLLLFLGLNVAIGTIGLSYARRNMELKASKAMIEQLESELDDPTYVFHKGKHTYTFLCILSTLSVYHEEKMMGENLYGW